MSFRDLIIKRSLEERIDDMGLDELDKLKGQINADLKDVDEEHRILKGRLDMVEDRIKKIQQGGGDD